MKFVDEYHDEQAVHGILDDIGRIITRPWKIMEICGGQTHSIVKHGIDLLLPDEITLLHGPGCPVCVTPAGTIDKAITLASEYDVILCSFGDMMRVPGNGSDLLSVKAAGAGVRMVYSPLDAVRIARDEPDREVVFFAIGFETTAPAHAAAVFQAHQEELANFSILSALVRVPPAIEILLSMTDCEINGFLAAGHVCTVMGYREYEPIAEKYKVPIVVTGFEPVDIIQGIHMAIRQLESDMAGVENQYARAVKKSGNLRAREMMQKMFEVVDREWRGIGIIPQSGLGLTPEFEQFDAERKFSLADTQTDKASECIGGDILRGKCHPTDCSAFGKSCMPDHPLGAPMVSSEGACAAYYHYRKMKTA